MFVLVVAVVLKQISYYSEQTVTIQILSWNIYVVIMLKFVLAHFFKFHPFLPLITLYLLCSCYNNVGKHTHTYQYIYIVFLINLHEHLFNYMKYQMSGKKTLHNFCTNSIIRALEWYNTYITLGFICNAYKIKISACYTRNT